MAVSWLAGAATLALASFVYGLTGFGIGLVSLSLLPFFIPPTTVVPLITIYGALFALVLTIQLRHDVLFTPLCYLLLGSVLGTPLGVWILSTLSPSALRRLIGVLLVGMVVLEWSRVYPEKLAGRRWSLCAGALAGVLGGAIAAPGPPVILYALAQGWSPRVMKAMLQTFFLVNHSVIVLNHWWAGLVTAEVRWLACLYLLPSALGMALGIRLFDRIEPLRFRRLLFAMLLILGLAMGLRG